MSIGGYVARNRLVLEPMRLTLGRKRVIAVGVALSNLPILSVNEHFAALVFCDLARELNSLCLRVHNFCCSRVARAFDGPVVSMWNYMLIFLGHDKNPRSVNVELWQIA